MKREQLSKKDLKELIGQLESRGIVCTFSKKNKAEKIDNKILAVNGEPDYFFHEGKIYPSLKLILREGADRFKKISVDEGAVKFVIKGADVMRPGVVDIDEGISTGDFIVITDCNHGKPLAEGISLYGSDEMRALEKGKIVKNIHHVGDALWMSEL